MTQEEFDNTKFRRGMKVVITGDVHDLLAVDFVLNLIGVPEESNMNIGWYPIEICTILNTHEN